MIKMVSIISYLINQFNTIIMSSLPVSSIAAYAQQLEDMIAEKQEQLETLREKTRAFR